MKGAVRRASFILLVIVLVQVGAAAKNRQKQDRKLKPQQPLQQPLAAYLGLLAASTAPSVAAHQAVQKYNHSLPVQGLRNGECAWRGLAMPVHHPASPQLHRSNWP